LWAISNQIGLWEAKLHGTWLPFGGISAMPSIHLAMATLFALLAFSVRRWLGIVFIGYVLVIQIGSVILGWHYAVDGYAGILLALLIWYAVNRFTMSSNSKPEIIDAT
jgi:membrane-associated phospholipid phosphatase